MTCHFMTRDERRTVSPLGSNKRRFIVGGDAMTDLRDSFYMPPKIETNGMTLDASNSMVKEDGISTLKDNVITHEQ